VSVFVVSIAPVVWAADNTQPKPQSRSKETERISAPIYYQDMMLIVSDADGVAVVIFKDEWHENAKYSTNCGVHYQFRYLGRDAKAEVKGEGLVREKHRSEQTADPKVRNVVDIEDRLFIEAGSIRFEWSEGWEGHGWIYYAPEKLTMQIGNAKKFSDLDLQRFQKR
jgi:hypothetical protein